MVLSGSVAHLARVNACCMRIAGSACCTPKSRDTAVRIWLAPYCSGGDAAIRPRLHSHESSLARCPPTPRHGPCLLAAGRCGCCSCCMSVAITTSRIATRCRMVAAERCRVVQGVISQAASRARGSHPHFSHSAPSHWRMSSCLAASLQRCIAALFLRFDANPLHIHPSRLPLRFAFVPASQHTHNTHFIFCHIAPSILHFHPFALPHRDIDHAV